MVDESHPNPDRPDSCQTLRPLSDSVIEQKCFIVIGQANAAGEDDLLSVGAEMDNTCQPGTNDLATFTRIDGEESCISRVVEEINGCTFKLHTMDSQIGNSHSSPRLLYTDTLQSNGSSGPFEESRICLSPLPSA